MLPGETPWRRFRRRIHPVTRRVPGGHLVTAAGTYARSFVPGLPRPERRFVIFAQGRSGSTLLADLVNSHPEVVCDDEILTFRRHWPARYADACSAGHRATVWGFKVKIYQLTDAQGIADVGTFLRGLHDDGWIIIHLHRRNVMRQALSSMIADLRGGLYHRPAGATAAPLPAHVRIDPDELVVRCEERERFIQEEDRALAGVPHLSLVYEDDLLDSAAHQATADRVFEYLGVDTVPVRTVLTRLSTRPLDGVVNDEEVRQRLSGTAYDAFLRQD